MMGTTPKEPEMYTVALIIPPGFAQVALQFQRDGDPDPWYITYAVDSSAWGGNYNSLANDIVSIWAANTLDALPTDTRITGVQLRVGQDGTDPLTLYYPIVRTGTGSGQTLPQNCAVLVTKVTSRPGRTGKGRFFWPTIAEGQVNGLGQIDPTYRTSFNASLSLVFLAHEEGFDSGDPLPMYLLHNNGSPGGTLPTVIDGLLVDPVISTQRRRLR